MMPPSFLHVAEYVIISFLFLFTAFFVVIVVDNTHSNKDEMESYVVLVSISLMISDSEYFFTCLLVICKSYLVKCLFKSFVHSLMSCLGFFLLLLLCFVLLFNVSFIIERYFCKVL